MTIIYNKHKQKEKRKLLRKNSTLAEKILWAKLKNKQLGVKFRRQYGIGHYIADFCCPRRKTVIEIDGGAHAERGQIHYDQERTKDIKELGFKVIRFNNEEVECDINKVIAIIKAILN